MTAFRTYVAELNWLLWTAVACCLTGWSCPVAAANDPSPPSTEVKIYDADPKHLWNRLHRALWVRLGPDGKAYGLDRLDPLLWFETKHLLEGKSHEEAIAVLDEFLAKEGEKLVRDPLRRAILQRDLWALFDWSTEPGENTREAHVRRSPPARLAMQKRLARAIQRLALSAEEAKGLPDNYAAAVASRAFAEQYDSDHPELPFLPPDLFRNAGPWVEVEIDNGSVVAATRHVFDFGARSAFRVFLRFPAGRDAIDAYFNKLRDFPEPWVITREDGRTRDSLVLSSKLPQFPAGTQTALVRQMLLVDHMGRIVTTRVTESVQLRVFRVIPEVRERDRPPTLSRTQDFFEFTRSRALLFAGQTGGLRALTRDDKDFRTQLLVHTHDEFELPNQAERNIPFDRQQGQPMLGCLGCHDRPGIYSFRTFTGGDYPRGRFYLPDLHSNDSADMEGILTAMRKREQYSWGLLQGLWQDPPPK